MEKSSADELLRNHSLTAALRFVECRAELGFGVNERHADARAAADRLYDAGQAELVEHTCRAELAAVHGYPARGVDALAEDDAFAYVFVHRYGAARVRTARVDDAVAVEQRLELTVLSHTAVQREKDDIRRAACVDNAPADKLAAALFAAAQRNTLGTQRVEIGLGLRSGARGYRLIRKARQLAEIHINIDHRNAVSAFDKSGGYLAARRERNVSFGAEPACKNKNIHHCFLSYNAYTYN